MMKEPMPVALLQWCDPRSDEHGNPLDRNFALEIYHGLHFSPADRPIGVVQAGVQVFLTPPLHPGSHFFTVVAVDSDGDQSRQLVIHVEVPR